MNTHPTHFASASCYLHVDSPLGRLLLVSNDGRSLAGVYMEAHARGPALPDDGRPPPTNAAPFDEVRRQLDRYFSRKLRTFDLDTRPVGTPFQLRVWRALQAIPWGATSTYGAIARVLGQPSASRAVGSANARNPLSIVVPCHRVVGTNGALTGYAGGEARKRWLLDHER